MAVASGLERVRSEIADSGEYKPKNILITGAAGV